MLSLPPRHVSTLPVRVVRLLGTNVARRVEQARSKLQERSLLALSFRTGADRERQQRIGYGAFAEPTMNER
jgi:hypothetical protein